MEYGALRVLRSAPHVIVLGNGKGGTGKTTLAMHVAVGLLDAGQKVATLDLDSDQRCLTCYLDSRRVWAKHAKNDLAMPLHRCLAAAEGTAVTENEAADLASLEKAVATLASSCDFLVIDTPSQDTYLSRVAHLIADSLLTPVQDSFLDVCSLGVFDPITHEVIRPSRYAASVCAARKVRRQFDPDFSDWIVIRRRTRVAPLIQGSLGEIGRQIGFRLIEGMSERGLYRKLVPLGLTAFDPFPEILGESCRASHMAGRNENAALIRRLNLPAGERGLRRAAARSEWSRQSDLPLQLDEIIAQD
jgi:chromosome partitioning protein